MWIGLYPSITVLVQRFYHPPALKSGLSPITSLPDFTWPGFPVPVLRSPWPSFMQLKCTQLIPARVTAHFHLRFILPGTRCLQVLDVAFWSKTIPARKASPLHPQPLSFISPTLFSLKPVSIPDIILFTYQFAYLLSLPYSNVPSTRRETLAVCFLHRKPYLALGSNTGLKQTT